MTKKEEWSFKKVFHLFSEKRTKWKLLIDDRVNQAIKKRIRYQNGTWTIGNEALGTLPLIYWYHPTADR